MSVFVGNMLTERLRFELSAVCAATLAAEGAR